MYLCFSTNEYVPKPIFLQVRPLLLSSQEAPGSHQRQAAAVSGEVQAEVSPKEERHKGRVLRSVKMAPPVGRQMAATTAHAAAAAAPAGMRC